MSVTECHTRGVWMRPILQLFAICPIVMLASPFFFQNPHGMMITIVSSPLSIALSQTCLVDVSTLSTRRQVSTRRQGPVYPASFALSELELILTSLTLYHDMLCRFLCLSPSPPSRPLFYRIFLKVFPNNRVYDLILSASQAFGSNI